MDVSLQGKVALVTGSSTGIGRATATVLARQGARLVIVARRRPLLESLAAEIEAEASTRPLIVAADLLDPSSVGSLMRSLSAHELSVDILVNNAGGSRPLGVDAPEAAWTEAMDLNYTVGRRMTQAFLAPMRQRGWGRIINVTGTNEPRGLNGAHPATAAMHAWAKGLSREVAKDGVTINSISPGHTISEQILRLYPSEQERRKFAQGNIPAGYFGEPEDIANVIAFVASPAARYMTGEVLHVDGGMRRFAH